MGRGCADRLARYVVVLSLKVLVPVRFGIKASLKDADMMFYSPV